MRHSSSEDEEVLQEQENLEMIKIRKDRRRRRQYFEQCYSQCDHIWQFIALWATFTSERERERYVPICVKKKRQAQIYIDIL